MERDLTYEWNSEVFAYLLAAAFSKQRDLLIAMWALKVAHVFNDTDNWHIELVEHPDRLDCNIHCYVLRRGYYENTRYRYCLRYCQWRVACAGRKVYYQII